MKAHDEQRLTIRAKFPFAQAVFIMGDFNNWSTAATPMSPMGRGQWEVQLDRHAHAHASPACFFVWERGQTFGRLVRQRFDDVTRRNKCGMMNAK
jgi:hypothetical protein